MVVHFSPEQEAQLSRIAAHTGTDTEGLAKDAALRLVEDAARSATPYGKALPRPTAVNCSKTMPFGNGWSGESTLESDALDSSRA